MLERLSIFDAELHFKALSPGDVTHSGNETARRLVSGHAGIAADQCMPALTEWDSNQEQLQQSPSQNSDSVSGKTYNDERDDTANDNGYDDNGDDEGVDDVQPLNIWDDQPDPSELDAACLEELAASLSTSTSNDDMHDNPRSNHARLSPNNGTRTSTIPFHRSTAHFEFGQEES
jgi:hypothetical protein